MANISPFKKGLNKAERSLDRFGRKMQQTGKSMSMKLTAPLAALGAVSFNVFKNFEFEMSKVKAVSGATAEEFAALEQNAKDLGASTMFSASQVAGLQTEFAKLGFSASEINKVTESTLNLAQASGADLAHAAEVAGSTLRAFGLDASETGRVTDVMASSFSSSALDINLFADSMKFVAPVAKSAGMSLEQTSAMLAVLANNGIKGSQAGTALRRIISEIGATGKPVSEALQDLAKQGLNLADAKDEVGRSAQSALLVLAEGVDQIAPLTQEFENSAGAAKEMSDIMGDTAFGASKRLESAMEGLGISVGEIVAEAVVPMVEGIAELASKLNKASPSTKRMIVVMASLAAAIGPVLFITGGMIRNFRILKIAVVRTGVATKVAAAAQRLLNLAMAANPVGLLVAGLTAVVGVFMALNREQEEAVEKQRELSDEAKKEIAQTTIRQRQANQLINAIKDENTETDQKKRLIKKLNDEYGDLLPNLVDEKDNLKDLIKLQNQMNNQIGEKIALMAMQDKLSSATSDAVDAQKKLNDEIEIYDDLSVKAKESFGIAITDNVLKDMEAALKTATMASGVIKSMSGDQIMLARELLQAKENITEYTGEVNTAVDEVEDLSNKTDKLANAFSSSSPSIADTDDKVGRIGGTAKDTRTEFEKLGDEIHKQFLRTAELRDLAKLVGTTTITIDGIDVIVPSGFQEDLELEEIEEEFDDIDFEPIDPAKMDKTSNTVSKAFVKMQVAAMDLNKTMSDMMKGMAIDTIAGMADIAGAMMMGEASMADMQNFLLSQFAKMLSQLGKMFIEYGIALKGFKMSTLTMNPALAIAAGAGLIAISGMIGAHMKKMAEGNDIPALAKGGIVTGPTLALIGEGRESEAVIPLSKLDAMMTGGRQSVTVHGRISGQDILLSSEKATRTRSRYRGF
jgi:hypothetical protein